jgi:hypothetical protein
LILTMPKLEKAKPKTVPTRVAIWKLCSREPWIILGNR